MQCIPIGIWASDDGKRGVDEGMGASDGEEAAADDGGIVMREMGY
jgi:hypothetical protein